MKPNELQIGDFVLYNDNICIVDEIRVDNTVVLTALNTDATSIDGDQVSVDEIMPIPLTAEILEKNGFVEFMPHNWQIVIDNIMIELRESEHNMAIWLDWEEHDTGTYASYMLPGPNCVHELQHALRLCNIDKEIEL